MSASITPEDVKNISNLARVGLTDQEAIVVAKDLANIFGYFSQIQELDTKEIPTSDDVTGLNNITRADEASPESLCSIPDLIERAPDSQDSQVKVKAVF